MEKTAYQAMNERELRDCYAAVRGQYDILRSKHLSQDMSRGKPGQEQLDLSAGLLTVLSAPADCVSDGIEVRNYGTLGGLPAAKRLFAEILGCQPEEIFVGGSSSLNLMYDFVARAFTHGLLHSKQPWCRLEKVKWLCPVPGYDRHFRITEYFGCELITIPMHEDGPDMDKVEEYVNNDPAVKGIWCVPKYSNPLGVSYSDEVVRRFANLTPAAPDFRLYWDNAYSIHHLYDEEEEQDTVLEILEECRNAGHPDIVYKFISTSKVTFPGSGLAALATSRKNLGDIKKYMTVQTIGHDKLNQLRHVRFFGNIANMREHMKLHAAIMRPKFELVEAKLDRELGDLEIATWTKPRGGYFISFDSLDGCAKKIVAKAAEAGVRLTDAGATFPYGIDPRDRNIRIAPSFPTEKELRKATEVFVVSVKLVSVNKYLKEMASEETD